MVIVTALLFGLLTLLAPAPAFATADGDRGDRAEGPVAAVEADVIDAPEVGTPPEEDPQDPVPSAVEATGEAAPPSAAPSAAAAAAAAPAPGRAILSGTITGLQHLPRGKLSVHVVSLDGEDWHDEAAVKVTGNTGTFRGSDVPRGDYRLVLSVRSATEFTYLSHQFLSIDGGYQFKLTGGKSHDLSFTAVAGDAALSGSIAVNGGLYMPAASVYQRIGGSWAQLWSAGSEERSSSYVIGGLVPGEYRVKLEGRCTIVADPAPNWEGDWRDLVCWDAHPRWWPGVEKAADAATLTLAAGQRLDGIDGDLTTGMARASFSEQNVYRHWKPVTREAMAAFMYRYAGAPEFTPPAKPSFTDVPRNHKFYREIEWMKKQGLTTGIREGGKLAYRPKSSVSREAMAAFLYRYAGKPAFDATQAQTFRDVPRGHQFAREINWMSSTGITTGVQASGGLVYQPLTAVKRDAMAAFLHRYDRSR
jgi:hypothetical protein